jgi:hypothetical protein
VFMFYIIPEHLARVMILLLTSLLPSSVPLPCVKPLCCIPLLHTSTSALLYCLGPPPSGLPSTSIAATTSALLHCLGPSPGSGMPSTSIAASTSALLYCLGPPPTWDASASIAASTSALLYCFGPPPFWHALYFYSRLWKPSCIVSGLRPLACHLLL